MQSVRSGRHAGMKSSRTCRVAGTLAGHLSIPEEKQWGDLRLWADGGATLRFEVTFEVGDRTPDEIGELVNRACRAVEAAVLAG